MKLNLKEVAQESKDRYSRVLTGLKEQEESGDVLEKLRGLVGKTVELPLKYIALGENVRRNLSEEDPEFEKLVNSIRKNGLLQNLVANLIEHDNGKWELRLSAGERRYRACKNVGLERVPVMIRLWDSQLEEIYAGLAENEDRENLRPLDVADAYARLVKLGASVDEIAERANRQKRTVKKYLYLSSLPNDVRGIIDARPDVFTTGVLFNEIASRGFNSEHELRNHIQGLIKDRDPVGDGRTEPETEAGASQSVGRDVKSRTRLSRPADPKLVEEIVGRISNSLPVKVKVKGSRERGRITISYSSQEQLDQLLSLFRE